MMMKDNNIEMVIRRVARFLPLYLLTFLPLLWGCSSDSDNGNSSNDKVIFTESASPTWAIDWSSDATFPNWQEPVSEDFECSMDLLVTLNDEYLPFSTDNDVMSVFIGGECRAISYRNVMNNGDVVYLLHIKGSSEEVYMNMELRFYCDKLHALNISQAIPPFIPNNLMEETYQLWLDPYDGSTKYPYYTQLAVMLPKQLPFTFSENDKMAVFVGDECRGIGSYAPELYDDWRVNVYSKQPNETAQIRYYSADKGGVYTILKTITLNDDMQLVNIEF